MARPSEKERIIQMVTDYLQENRSKDHEKFPFNVKSIASELNISRTTIYKYALNEKIREAEQERQKKTKLSGKLTKPDRSIIANQQLRNKLKEAEKHNRALVARLIMVEANAARLGLNAEELFKPIIPSSR